MYRFLKNFLLIFSFALLTCFTIYTITTISSGYASGTKPFISINKANLNLHKELENIALTHHIIIAKEIYLDKNDGTGNTTYVFEKIGKGTLPNNFPEEKKSNILSKAPDIGYYYIIGNSIRPNTLVKQLNALGNQAGLLSNDIRWSTLNDLNLIYRIPVGIILIAFAALVLVCAIERLKSDGIRRLSGISRFRLAFFGILKEGQFIVFLTILFSGLAIGWFTIQGHFSFYYSQIILTTLSIGGLIFFMLSLIISTLLFYLLQIQPINLSIKGKSPFILIFVVTVFFQSFALFASMHSITSLNQASHLLSNLQSGQTAWKKKQQYFATTLSLSNENPENIKKFTLNLLNLPDTILATNTFSQRIGLDEMKKTMSTLDTSPYSPLNPGANVMMVNMNYLKASKIHLDNDLKNKLNQLKSGQYGILIPSQRHLNIEDLGAKWAVNETSIGLMKNSIITTYSDDHPFFAFNVIAPYTASTESFSQSPIFIIVNEKSFEKIPADTISNYFEMFLSSSQIIITHPSEIKILAQKYHLENTIGAFVNGYYGITARVSRATHQRNLLIAVNILCLFSSLILISLLNSIYLYQNRKQFLILRLAGKSRLEIHKSYLAIVFLLLTLISLVAKYLLHLPNEALLVSVIYLFLIFSLFAIQIWRDIQANVLYLKGL
ncbi:DUF1430 domain-containing protein [Lactococcus hircilactis]|uniref:DUF1430 domain-containing protein n=1 Tax=Lactococcus hircilactis TaxID=1494462 RepID=UPI003FA1D212